MSNAYKKGFDAGQQDGYEVGYQDGLKASESGADIAELEAQLQAMTQERDFYKDRFEDYEASAEMLEDFTSGATEWLGKTQQRIKKKNQLIRELEARLAAESADEILFTGKLPDLRYSMTTQGLSDDGPPNVAAVYVIQPDGERPQRITFSGRYNGSALSFSKLLTYSHSWAFAPFILEDVNDSKSFKKYGISREHFLNDALPTLIDFKADEDDESHKEKLDELARTALYSEPRDKDFPTKQFNDWYKKVCRDAFQHRAKRVRTMLNDPDFRPIPPSNAAEIGTTKFVAPISDENS